MTAPVVEPTTDVLGEPWLARTIRLAPHPAYGRQPRAILVHQAPRSQAAVLYLHGFSDYVFQAAHAQRWIDAGIDFYGLDLRLNGRAIDTHPRPGDVRDLRDHDEEITAALAHIRSSGHERIVLLGHSTGGLIAASFAQRYPGSIEAVALNSPWLEHHGPWWQREVASRFVALLARWLPSVVVGRLDAGYGRHLHRSTGGEHDYRLDWKPLEGFAVRAGFFAAVRAMQREVVRRGDITVPTLLCCSTHSGPPAGASVEEQASADCVLNVDDMLTRGVLLGHDVTIFQVPGGIHDLALSPPEARSHYEAEVIAWAGEVLEVG